MATGSRRTKPTPQLRRPPPPDDPAAVQRFVEGGPSAQAEPPPAAPPRPALTAPAGPVATPGARGRGLVHRGDGRTLRRVTAYLEPDVGRRLAIYCATEGAELSVIVGEAVAEYLRAREA